jgi:hypothetical protein
VAVAVWQCADRLFQAIAVILSGRKFKIPPAPKVSRSKNDHFHTKNTQKHPKNTLKTSIFTPKTPKTPIFRLKTPQKTKGYPRRGHAAVKEAGPKRRPSAPI